MQSEISKLGKSFHKLDLRSHVFRSRSHSVNKQSEEQATSPAKPSTLSARERLDSLSSLRIRPNAIKTPIANPVGAGGKAEVTKTVFRSAWNHQQEVAVKKLRFDNDTNRSKLANELARELEVMAGLSHQNIVRLIGFVEELERGKAWIILAWEANGNLSEFLASGDWEILERVSLIKDTFDGIRYLHTREPPICHGDLKSLNILVSSSYRAVITDFGSARTISLDEDETISVDSALTVAGASLARDGNIADCQVTAFASRNHLTFTGPSWSLRWAAPEIAMGGRQSLASDIWAAGWVCWEIMTNQMPFNELNAQGPITLKIIQGEVPVAHEDEQLGQVIRLCSLMTGCWQFNPRSRPHIFKCWNEVVRIPSTRPSGPKAPSTELLLQTGRMQYTQGYYKSALSLFQRALSSATIAEDQIAIADSLYRLGQVYAAQSQFSRAEESFIKAQAIYSRGDATQGQGNALLGLAGVSRLQCKYDVAEGYYLDAEEIYTRVGHEGGRASTLRGLGHLYRLQSKYTEAERSFTESLDICDSLRDYRGRANALRGLGDIDRLQSKYAEAQDRYAEAHDIYSRLCDQQGQENALRGLGDVNLLQSQYTKAEKRYKQALDICIRTGHQLGQANTLRGLGHIYWRLGQEQKAVLLYAAARGIYTEIGRSQDADRTFGYNQAEGKTDS